MGAGDAVADIRRADDGDGRVRLVGASGSDGNQSGEEELKKCKNFKLLIQLKSLQSSIE